MEEIVAIIVLFAILFSIGSVVAPIVFPIAIVILIGVAIYYAVIYILKIKYFNSEEFLNHKAELEQTISEFNEISLYADSIKNSERFTPNDNKLSHTNLASFENTSRYDYKRDRNVRDEDLSNVYATSLSVVRRASEEPIKYLCKYFNFKQNKETLDELSLIGDNISRIENAIENLNVRKREIESEFSPPWYIMKHFYKELMEKIGFIIPEIEFIYPEYIFHYLSAGGNSSQKTTIRLDSETIEAVSEYIADKIKFKKSAKYQRALMTNSLRSSIKKRDKYTCQNCGVSIHDQSLLLLEIDHIIPISKGGLSTPDNLQTLCWKCNRTKSNKIV